jgi:UDP-glucose 4-epimerase
MDSQSHATLQGPVFVTGASGFIGSCLVPRLLEAGVAVRSLQFPGEQNRIPPGVAVVPGDLADLDAVAAAMCDSRIVFHLGGIASAVVAEQAPYEAMRANTLGAGNVMEAARRAGAAHVVILSTAHVYGIPRALPLTEDQPFAPLSVYASTKLAGDTLALAYYRNLGVPVSVLRAFNVYGPGQRTAAIIPTIVEQAVRSGTVHVRDPRPRRDFVYVDDIVDAMIAAAVSAAAGGEMLLASGSAVSVRSLVGAVLAIVNGSSEPDFADTESDNSDCVYGSAERARNALGWRPRVDLATGLRRTVAWWREQVV